VDRGLRPGPLRDVPADGEAVGDGRLGELRLLASHSRWFWGLRLYLACTPAGLPVLRGLADPRIGEREVLEAMIETDADLIAERNGILLISDKGFAGKEFEQSLSEARITLLRPSRAARRPAHRQPGRPHRRDCSASVP
jgi:hypothetical protein